MKLQALLEFRLTTAAVFVEQNPEARDIKREVRAVACEEHDGLLPGKRVADFEVDVRILGRDLCNHNLRAEYLLDNILNNKSRTIDFVCTNSVQAKGLARVLDHVGVNLVERYREVHHHKSLWPLCRNNKLGNGDRGLT